MIGDWPDEWDSKRRGSDRSVNRHGTCRGAAYLNHGVQATLYAAPVTRGVITLIGKHNDVQVTKRIDENT
jgi:hypothetical protein